MSAPRKDLLDRAAALICGDRDRTYGAPIDLFRQAARIARGAGLEITPREIVLVMIAVKLARIGVAPDHRDSHDDLAGYTAILWEVQEDGSAP